MVYCVTRLCGSPAKNVCNAASAHQLRDLAEAQICWCYESWLLLQASWVGRSATAGRACWAAYCARSAAAGRSSSSRGSATGGPASSSFGGGWASDAFDVSGLEESELDVGVSTAAEEPVLASRRCSRPRAADRSFDSSARRHACGGGSIRREGWRGRQESTAGDTEESSWPGGPATTGSCRAAALHSPFADHSRYRLAALRSSSLASSTGAEPAKGEGLQRSLLEQRSPTTETEGYDRAADTETGPAEAVEVSGVRAGGHGSSAACVRCSCCGCGGACRLGP